MRAYATFLAPSPRGFSGPRGWYVTDDRETVVAGPFPSESEALAAKGSRKRQRPALTTDPAPRPER
jgi:hypothetical protein